VPLSDAAITVLEWRCAVRSGDVVFPGRTSSSPLSYASFSRAPIEAGINAASPHSWRSVFSDVAAERLGIARETREMALAHSLPGGATEEAYRRGRGIEARRAAAEAYALWLLGESKGNVTSLRRA
jgi:hypothetical protein